MTQPVQEPTTQRSISSGAYGQRQLFRRPGQVAAGEACYSIKVFRDDIEVETGDGRFIYEIPEDLDNADLVRVEGYITTAGAGSTSVMIRNATQAVDMLSTAITIDSGELNSKDAAVQPVVNGANATVAWGDHLSVDVDSAAAGSMGLGVILFFIAEAGGFFIVRGPDGSTGPTGPTGPPGPTGPQGDPGGIVNFTGEWDSGTAYVVDDAVSHNGSSYVAIDPSTNVEPGVDPGWETDWMLLAQAGTGGLTQYESRSTNTILGIGDTGRVIDITAAITQTFDPAATLGQGWWVVLRNATTDGETVLTLNPDGGETIDGLTTVTMYSGETRLIVSDGAAGFNSELQQGGFARFPTSGSFIVPASAVRFTVECIGGGGGGGGGRGGSAGTIRQGGSGGGGGAFVRSEIFSEALGNPGDTITVTCATGGTGGTGGSAGNGNPGGSGGDTTFGAFVTGYGGGGASGGFAASPAVQPGTGGGHGEAGEQGSHANEALRGGATNTAMVGLGGGGGGADPSFGSGYGAEYGGGGGGHAITSGASGAFEGGTSRFGAGAGGGGGGLTTGNAESAGGAGGGVGTYNNDGGGGGTLGAANGGNGGDGADGDLLVCGEGGGGGGSQNSGTGGSGGNGGSPGGGGGGGAGGTTVGGDGGDGGDGECRVWYA